MQAILMVGEQRSGSNLLRVMLNEAKEIAAPHPPHILQRMMPLLPLYGDLQQEANFAKLIDDVCKLVEFNPVQWDGVVLDRADVRSRCRTNSLVAIFGAVMDLYAEANGATSWMCKSMQNIRWADDIDEYFDDAKYIFLYRDGRDVALSFKKAPVGDKHTYFVAQKWSELQELCLTHRDKVGSSQFVSVCYEELIEAPQKVLSELCAFLGIEFRENMLSFYRSKEATQTAKSSELWNNITKPVMANNSKKYKKEMAEKDIKIFESVAGKALDQLNYTRDIVQTGEEIQYSKEQIDSFQEENQLLIKQKQAETDVEDLQRRSRQVALLSEIKSRVSLAH